MITLRQMLAILIEDECMEIGTSDHAVELIYFGGETIPDELEPYLDWLCVQLGSASLDSTGVTISPLGEHK